MHTHIHTTSTCISGDGLVKWGQRKWQISMQRRGDGFPLLILTWKRMKTCWSHHPTAHKLTVSQSACWVILATELWCGLHTYTWSVCMCLHTRGILVSSFWLEKSQGDTKPCMQWLPIGVVTHVHPCSIWLSRAGAHAQCYQLPLHCWLRFAWFWGWSHCQTPMINHWTSPFVL